MHILAVGRDVVLFHVAPVELVYVETHFLLDGADDGGFFEFEQLNVFEYDVVLGPDI